MPASGAPHEGIGGQLLNAERQDRVQGAVGNPEVCFARGRTVEVEKDGPAPFLSLAATAACTSELGAVARAGDLPGARENTDAA